MSTSDSWTRLRSLAGSGPRLGRLWVSTPYLTGRATGILRLTLCAAKGTKTVQQVRSHAQKHFLKAIKNGSVDAAFANTQERTSTSTSSGSGRAFPLPLEADTSDTVSIHDSQSRNVEDTLGTETVQGSQSIG